MKLCLTIDRSSLNINNSRTVNGCINLLSVTVQFTNAVEILSQPQYLEVKFFLCLRLTETHCKHFWMSREYMQ